jgi:hypothetical protein
MTWGIEPQALTLQKGTVVMLMFNYTTTLISQFRPSADVDAPLDSGWGGQESDDLEEDTAGIHNSNGLDADTSANVYELYGLEDNTPGNLYMSDTSNLNAYESDVPEGNDVNPLQIHVWTTRLNHIESRFNRFVDSNTAQFLNKAIQHYCKMGSNPRIQSTVDILTLIRGQVIGIQDDILQLMGPNSDLWMQAELLRKKIGISIDWIEEVLCAILIGSQEVTYIFRKHGFEFQQE